MKKYKKIYGDLIYMARGGKFDVIAHGCNCFCSMNMGISPLFAKFFKCDTYKMEQPKFKGDVNKLGTIDFESFWLTRHNKYVDVINVYTQYEYGDDPKKVYIDYEALKLGLRKINKIFAGKSIGLPRIGCGGGRGEWKKIDRIIKKELRDMNVTVVSRPRLTI